MRGVTDLISPTGRALQSQMSSLPPDQFNTLAQQYIEKGLLSFSDLLSIKSQYDYLKKNGQQAQPPSSTVVQDMQGAMGGGVASLPAGDLAQPQRMAKGGIVSFAGGGIPTQLEMFPNSAEILGSEYRGPYDISAERIARIRAAERAKAAAGDVGFAPTNEAKGVKGILGKERTILGEKTWRGLGSKAAKAGKEAVTHPLKTAKAVGRVAGPAALTFGLGEAAWDTGVLAGMDPRYLREAYGSEDPYSSEWGLKDIGQRGLAVVQDIIPFAGELTGGESLYEQARAKEKADRVALQGEPWEIKMAEDVKALRKQGRDEEADALTLEYRKRKGGRSNDYNYFSGIAEDLGPEGEGGGGTYIPGADFSSWDKYANYLEGLAADKKKEIEKGNIGYYEALKKDAEAAGLYKGTAERKARLAEKEAKLGFKEKQDKWLAAASAFFKMAQAGGQYGDFGSAMGEGAAELGKGMMDARDTAEARRDKLEEAMYAASLAEDQANQGMYTTAYGERSKDEDAMRAAEQGVYQTGMQRDTVKMERDLKLAAIQVQERVAQIYANSKDKAQAERVLGPLRDAWWRAMRDFYTTGDPQAKAKADEYLRGIEQYNASNASSVLAAREKGQLPPWITEGGAPGIGGQGYSAERVQ